MRRLHKYIATWMIICLMQTAFGRDIYVSTTGFDGDSGTITAPLATVAAALRMAREWRRLSHDDIAAGIKIVVRGGIYTLYQPLFIRPEDSGTTTTTIEAAPNEQPIFSGGFSIKGWQKIKLNSTGLPKTAMPHVWVANVPQVQGNVPIFRQLWVNGVKAIRAKDTRGETMNRILSWNKKEETCWIPTPKFKALEQLQGLEMLIHQWWAIAILRIQKMEVHGDSTKLFFHQPESKIQSEHPWPAPWISKETGNSAFYLTNSIAFVNEPGEWYLDAQNQKLYYYPRSDEDMHSANIMAPYAETLVQVLGTIDHPVSNIVFKGISFEYTGWLRPSQQGHVPHQLGMYMTDAYKLKPAGTTQKASLENQAWIGRPAAAVEVNFANRTLFENCRFQHLAATGLDYHLAVHNNTIQGNLFTDIGGTAMLVGVFSDPATEIHLAYNPKDDRAVCDTMLIANNLISNVTNEDWSCVGIGAGYVRNTTIEHNEIENVSYSGISMGWGWSALPNAMRNNRILANKIHHFGKHNYDCAGIYTLSAQPNSFITANYVDSIYKASYAHLPTHWFYLYGDEGSSFFTVTNNWTPSQKYLQNANGPGNVWDNNGPQVDATIKQQAGIQKAFQYLLKERATNLNTQPINEDRNEVIALIVKEGMQLNLSKLKQVLAQNKMDSTAIYRWQNNYIIFDKVVDIAVMQGRLQNNFPEVEVKVFHDMFYEFQKKKNCSDTSTSKQWDHIILTANLVADSKMQQEYLDYHATQFEKWPEVSRGFCNANFQQLLLFKNGRQLVLVISIPQGESLDKLNPKTTENNPRVNEWNQIMGKYQEGIQGTKKGETWVFLERL